MRVVFLDSSTIPGGVPELQTLAGYAEFGTTPPHAVVERCRDAEIVISNKVRLGPDVLSQLPLLKLVAVPATGVDHVDVPWCASAGIEVRNCEGYSETGVAEHALALMLALSRRLLAFRADIANGLWAASPHFSLFTHEIRDLHGCVLGIVGSGILGHSLARLARGLGLQVLYAERKNAARVRNGYTAFDEVLARCDFLSLHCPLVPETRHYIGRHELALMKPGAILINTSRGGLIDEAALLDALRSGHLAGAGLDVLSCEPAPVDHPLAGAGLTNLLITPHVAWISSTSLERLRSQLLGHIRTFIQARQVVVPPGLPTPSTETR